VDDLAAVGMAAANGRDKATKTGYVWHERYMWHHAGKYQ
jgi:hypothetical protein